MRTLLILLLVALPVAADDKPIAQRWSLKLLPEKLPELPAEFYGTKRIHTPPLTRGGNGFSDALTFRKADGDKPAQVEWEQTQFRNRQQTVKSSTLDLRVEKSLLEYGDLLRTAMLHEGVLAVNVAVPIDERTFYLVTSDRFTSGTRRVDEWLFEFDQDPRKEKTGQVTVKHAREQFPDSRPQQWETAGTFTVNSTNRGFKTIDLERPPKGGHQLPTLMTWDGRPYLALDEPNQRLIEYRPVR